MRSGCSLRCVQGNNDANPGSGVFGRLISKDGGAGEMLYAVTSALNQVTFFTSHRPAACVRARFQRRVSLAKTTSETCGDTMTER